jgi:hypothetical protein
MLRQALPARRRQDSETKLHLGCLLRDELRGHIGVESLAATFTADAAVLDATWNALPYGLASYVFTRSLKTSHHVSMRLEAGMVNVNHFGIALDTDTDWLPHHGLEDAGRARRHRPPVNAAALFRMPFGMIGRVHLVRASENGLP